MAVETRPAASCRPCTRSKQCHDRSAVQAFERTTCGTVDHAHNPDSECSVIGSCERPSTRHRTSGAADNNASLTGALTSPGFGDPLPPARRHVSMFTEPPVAMMSLVRMRAAVLVMAVAVATGCSSGSSHRSSTASTSFPDSSSNPTLTETSATSPARPLSVERACHRVLRSRDLLAWAPGTVAQFRAYQYGGPRPTVPLAHAFRGVPGGTRGAWCGTRAGRQATRWWAAIVGHRAASDITIHGPGEGVRRGAVSSPPRVP